MISGAVPADVPEAPPPELRFQRSIGLGQRLREIFASRELVASLVERDLRVRYKQAVLGFGWAVMTPLSLMIVFSVFFQRVARVDTGDVAYALFAYLGLLPWGFFSSSISQGGLSLVNNVPLLNKVYCPREVFPVSSVGVALVDMLVATGVLGVLFVIYTEMPQPESLFVPILFLIQIAFTLGLALVMSVVVVYLRDLRNALPIFLQLGLFATPVAYSLDSIPHGVRPFYVAVNPLAAVIDGYRRCVLFGQAPRWGLTAIAGVAALTMLFVGHLLFRRLETGIADVA